MKSREISINTRDLSKNSSQGLKNITSNDQSFHDHISLSSNVDDEYYKHFQNFDYIRN